MSVFVTQMKWISYALMCNVCHAMHIPKMNTKCGKDKTFSTEKDFVNNLWKVNEIRRVN